MGLVFKERSPSLRMWHRGRNHILGHSGFGEIMAAEAQFGQDAGNTPCRVFLRHAANPGNDLGIYWGPAGRFSSRIPSPVQPEPATMPSDDHPGLNDDQGGPPRRPKTC
jgi:hypothetical protein